MIYTISNEHLTAEINSVGAELTRLVDNADGIEYVSPEANKDWENIAPVLFPNTGMVKDGHAVVDGGKYEYLKHGFARQSEFKVLSKEKNRIAFRLSYSTETLKIFPFEFVLSITYELDGRTLAVRTDIENSGKNRMYCSVGFHPGFSCPIDRKEKADDYVIAFPVEAYASRLNLVDGLVAAKTEHFFNGIQELPIKEKMFDNGSYSMTDLNFDSVKLMSKQSRRFVQLDFADYPNLILWAPRYKPISVVCIEPWYGQPDRLAGEKEISEKPYTLEIAPSSIKSLSFSVTCN